MLEFLTQLVTLPIWALILLAIVALLGVILLPITIVAVHNRKVYTQEGLNLMAYREDKIDEKVQEVLLKLEEEKEEQRKLACERKELAAAKVDLEKEKLQTIAEREKLEKERKDLEAANVRRDGLLKSIKSQNQALAQLRKETIVYAQKQAVELVKKEKEIAKASDKLNDKVKTTTATTTTKK